MKTEIEIKEIENIKINDLDIIDFVDKNTANNNNEFFNFEVENFKKEYKKYINTGSYKNLKTMISISFKLGINSAVFEQISLVLSKKFLEFYNRI